MRSHATLTKTAPAESKKKAKTSKKKANDTSVQTAISRPSSLSNQPEDVVANVLRTIADMVANNGCTTSTIEGCEMVIDGVKIKRISASLDILMK